MASSSSGQPAPAPSLFARHQLKVLNVGLMLYLCLGALLFDWLGEFDPPARTNQHRKSVATSEPGKRPSLQDLRLQSARRMWNITNQLNILYESNWTLLVLDELVEFERKFLDSLVTRGGEADEENEDKGDEEEEEEREKKERKDAGQAEDNKRRRRKSRRWGRSIRKSLIHSVATITTIGSPSGPPRTGLGKLLTLVYGALGLPLLLVTVGQSGRRLAYQSLNLLLVLRHYCLALPAHHLRSGCRLTSCLRLLAWCCCCCCCCLGGGGGGDDGAGSAGDKICDTKPRLRLSGPPAGGARRPGARPSPTRASKGNNQKSVRFVGQSKDSLRDGLATIGHHNHHHQQQQQHQHQQQEEENLFSRSTFLMSLSLLGAYLSLGAYAYSHHYNKPLLDGFLVSYEFVTGTKWPETLAKDPRRLDPMDTYELLKSNPVGASPPSLETFAWHLLYLVGGLNLVSMCGHYAHLWLRSSGGEQRRSQGDFLLAPLANGLLGSPDHSPLGSSNHLAGAYQLAHSNGPLEAAAEHFMSQTAGLIQQTDGEQPQQQQHIGLAELYVVGQRQQSDYQLRSQAPVVQQQQQTSDLSFASTDRSTDRNSLCLHHQQAAPAIHSASSAGSTAPSLYGHNNNNNHHHHHHHLHQQRHQQPHLYLVDGRAQDEEDEEDAEEMDRMLKSCLPSSGQCQHSANHPLRAYGTEQDNTNTTTTSSTLSRTTLKPNHLHLHQHQPIGFLLAESPHEHKQ